MAKSNEQPKRFNVVGVTEQVRPGNMGQFERVLEVSYVSATGRPGTVRLPVGDGTPEKVKAAIDADLDRLEAIYNL